MQRFILIYLTGIAHAIKYWTLISKIWLLVHTRTSVHYFKDAVTNPSVFGSIYWSLLLQTNVCARPAGAAACFSLILKWLVTPSLGSKASKKRLIDPKHTRTYIRYSEWSFLPSLAAAAAAGRRFFPRFSLRHLCSAFASVRVIKDLLPPIGVVVM